MASAYTGQSSALIGQPPSTVEDYWIVKGILASLGSHADPAQGVLIPPARPPNAHFETQSPQIVAADSVCMVLVILITGSRLLIRALHHGLKWGWDDWFMIVASVGVLGSWGEWWRSLTAGDVERGRDMVFFCDCNGNERWRKAYLVRHLSRIFMVPNGVYQRPNAVARVG